MDWASETMSPINLSSFKLLFSSISHNNRNLTNTTVYRAVRAPETLKQQANVQMSADSISTEHVLSASPN